MKEIKIVKIDWKKTGIALQYLRENNYNLKKYVCYYNKVNNFNDSERYFCYNIPIYDCDNCDKEMDKKISRRELGRVFSVSEDIVENWENGETIIDIEELIMYSKISGTDIFDILVFED